MQVLPDTWAHTLRQPPAIFVAVFTGHYIVTATARLRFIVKLSLKPRDVRDHLLSLTITPTVYSTCRIRYSLNVFSCAGSR